MRRPIIVLSILFVLPPSTEAKEMTIDLDGLSEATSVSPIPQQLPTTAETARTASDLAPFVQVVDFLLANFVSEPAPSLLTSDENLSDVIHTNDALRVADMPDTISSNDSSGMIGNVRALLIDLHASIADDIGLVGDLEYTTQNLIDLSADREIKTETEITSARDLKVALSSDYRFSHIPVDIPSSATWMLGCLAVVVLVWPRNTPHEVAKQKRAAARLIFEYGLDSLRCRVSSQLPRRRIPSC